MVKGVRHQVTAFNRFLRDLDAKQITALVAIVGSVGGFAIHREVKQENHEMQASAAASHARFDSLRLETVRLKLRVRRLEVRAHIKPGEPVTIEPEKPTLARRLAGFLPWNWGRKDEQP